MVQLDLSYQYLRDPRTRFIIPGLGLKLDAWTINGQIWWDNETRNMTQQDYKLHYGAQCWGLGLSYIIKPGERQYTFLFDLKGIGGMKI